MAARIDNARVQLLTRTGLDWTDKYPSAIAALANLNINTAYIDGELCGVDEFCSLPRCDDRAELAAAEKAFLGSALSQ
jgi:ATP-dependent DNA ligase